MAHRTCSVEECTSPAKVRGMCGKHYQRWIKAGGQTKPRPNYGTGIRLAPNGYTYRWNPDHPLAHRDGYVAEHRMVAWDCGILTDPAMHVHHLDHDKANNDPSNLTAMTQSEHHKRHIDEDGVENQYGRWVRNNPTCSVDGCERPTRYANLCAAHVSRLKRWGDVRAEVPVVPGQKINREVTPCASPVCDRDAKCLGWCPGHYGRLKSTGDAKPHRPIGKPGRPAKGT